MVIFIFYRILCFLLGITLTTIGITYVIIFSSLLGIGFSFVEFIRIIMSNNEIYLLIGGVSLIIFSLFFDNLWSKFISWNKGRRNP